MNYNIWKPEESNKLKKLINMGMSYDDIAIKYFPHRSGNSLRLHATRYLKIHNDYKHREYSFDKDFWKIPNVTNCYWAGFLGADGNVSKYSIRIELNA